MKADCHKKKKEVADKATMAADKEDDKADIALMVIEEPVVPEYLQNEKYVSFLRMVAEKKNITGHNIESWVDAVAKKLWLVGIKDHSQLLTELFTVNQKLVRANNTQFHLRTMGAITEVAGGYIKYLEDNLQPDNSIFAEQNKANIFKEKEIKRRTRKMRRGLLWSTPTTCLKTAPSWPQSFPTKMTGATAPMIQFLP
jgi:hypothetical protein